LAKAQVLGFLPFELRIDDPVGASNDHPTWLTAPRWRRDYASKLEIADNICEFASN
jgi:hypothetical protein